MKLDYVFEYLHKPAVNCFACMKLDTIDDAREEMRHRMSENDSYFAVTLKESDKVIGEIEAGQEPPDPHDPYPANDTYSPCWMLNLNYQGQGYAYEAVHAIFDYLFYEKGARRIYIYTEDHNIHVKSYAKSLECVRKVCLRNLYPLSTTLTVLLVMRTHINMLF